MAKLGIGPKEALTYYKFTGVNLSEDWFSANPTREDNFATLADFLPWIKDLNASLGIGLT